MTKQKHTLGIAATIALIMVGSTSAQELRHASASAHKRQEGAEKQHRLIIQVNSNDAAMMNLALNNAENVVQYYKDLHQNVSIDIVTFGPGLHMFREDTSPVKARIETLVLSTPEIAFEACGNTRENMRKPKTRKSP
jgi:hypothetical protein